ncbi:phosphoserine phosphatase serb [Basidiobolus meristosporus CBS 931.73]|uniref:phosphoserine phosphatase n=1 Tax=Basidiobolus meristosporus CBS 931.73 TaxID=1314790 RepID=A0A1Y1YCD3_9FUNG|nr:phosphoserine phosphatase serb [Basidiobolus meristosporus CBS 931.73]|eukprot:ORX95274.1 phosphoserine phosphatase serb [Basidiobolus meristosporus CBS 931.73]
MKFGNFITARKVNYPEAWVPYTIDYVALKSFIKQNIAPDSLALSKLTPEQLQWTVDSAQENSYANIITSRLGKLQILVGDFLAMLDKEVHLLNEFYVEETERIVSYHRQSEEDTLTSKEILQCIIKLESFVLLNYTAITKILKKHDRHSGLKISDSYLLRISNMSFVRSENLLTLKRVLLRELGESPLPPSCTSPELILSKKISPAEKKNWFPTAALLPHQKVLVSLTGPHGTDIIGCILQCASKHNCDIEDFMFSRLYHTATFGVLITLTNDNVAIFQDLAEAARRWDGTLSFEIQENHGPLPKSIEEAPYQDRVKYAATILNQNGLSAKFLYEWTHLLLKHKISVEKMARLNEGHVSCADYKLSVPKTVDYDSLRVQLFQLSLSHGTDVAMQPYDVFRRNKRLVVFDMDSTLIQQEVIDEIAKHAGVVDQVAAITEAAMNGEIDFKESLRRRVGLLKGTSVSVLDTVKESLTFTEGARVLCKALKKIGLKLAVISGGFMPLASYVKNELGLDYAFANQLKVSSDGLTLTGETVGPIVDGQRKAELLEVIAQAESVTLDQVIAVGDGANDLWMLAAAGLGIAFNAKPKVQERASTRINQKSLKYVLHLLGYTDEECRQLYE